MDQKKRQSNACVKDWVASNVGRPNQHKESKKDCGVIPGGYQTTMNAQAVTFEPAANYVAPSIGLDTWRQLKQVEIPTFSCNKKSIKVGMRLSSHVSTAPQPRASTSYYSFVISIPGCSHSY